ncbi:MAG: hypothetical protein M3458_19735 [Acidobacteriota bacterium]|nr:hypothetical protein [Acidobacteriota bacterium]
MSRYKKLENGSLKRKKADVFRKFLADMMKNAGTTVVLLNAESRPQ